MKVTWTQEEVCSLTGLEPHILRFWEGEFPQLRPRRNSAGQRVYRERDLEIVTRLKGWIYDEGLALPAARRRLKEEFETLQAPLDPEQLGMPFLESAPEASPAPAAPVPAASSAAPIAPAAKPEPAPQPVPEPAPEPPAAVATAITAVAPEATAPVSAPKVQGPDSTALRTGLLEVLSLLEAP